MKQYLKTLSVFGLFSILSTAVSLPAFAFSGSANGTQLSPYEIRTCPQLQEARQALSAHYKLMNDVDCTDVSTNPGWVPIGFISSAPFTGTFDGDGYAINNISYSGSGPAGLFGYVSGATIRNTTVSNSLFNSIGHVGAIAGDATNSIFEHVHARNTTVRADNRLGGLVGIMASSSSISDSSVIDGSIIGRELGSGSVFVGGAVGHATNTTINRVSVSGTVTGNESVANAATSIGGLIGYAQYVTIQDTYTTTEISGGSNVGGFIGLASSVTTRRSWTNSNVTAVTDVGGFYGYEGLSTAENSFASGKISGTTNVGGFIGHATAIGVAMDSSYWDVERTEQSDCVGFDESTAISTTCVGLNAGNAAPNYFFNTSSRAPFSAWDFINTWRTTDTTPLLATPPARPDNVRIARAANTLTTTWEVPADTGGGAITSYDIKYRKSADQTYTYVSGIASTSYTAVGLTPETEYTIEVRAQNARGKGTWLGFIAYTTAATPAVVTTEAITTTSISSEKITPATAAQYALDTLATEYPTENQPPQQSTSRGESAPQVNHTSGPKGEKSSHVDKVLVVSGIVILAIGLLGLLQYTKSHRA